jgi:poly(beta-D-mannuronate) lyase
MVGYGVGACFLNNIGANIVDGDCTIETAEQLTVSSLPTITAEGSTIDVSVVANISWTAVSNNSWITLDVNSGDGNAIVSVTVAKNLETNNRVGTVTFKQDPGGNDIVRTLTVLQEAAELTDLYNLINIGTGLPNEKVTLHSFSKEEVNGVDKFNYAKNTLDKDNETVWAADDGDILAGDYKGDGEYIIYDLSSIHTINLIQFTTTNKSDPFGFQIWVSTTGTDDSDFSMILPTSGELILTATNTTNFNQYEVNPVEALYIKIMGYGRFNSDADTRTSVWSAVGEIEFYGDEVVSVDENKFAKKPLIYPVPTKDILHLRNMDRVTSIFMYSMDGKIIMNKNLTGSELEINLNVSSISNGPYFLVLKGEKIYHSEVILISN